MKSIIEFINEGSFEKGEPKIISNYYEVIKNDLKNAIDSVDSEINDIINKLKSNDLSFILNKEQIYGTLIENVIFNNFKPEGFNFVPGRDNTNDKDFVCNKAPFKKLEGYNQSSAYSIQVKCSKSSSIKGNNPQDGFCLFVFYKKNGNSISINKAYFGYFDKSDWSSNTEISKSLIENKVKNGLAFEIK